MGQSDGSTVAYSPVAVSGSKVVEDFDVEAHVPATTAADNRRRAMQLAWIGMCLMMVMMSGIVVTIAFGPPSAILAGTSPLCTSDIRTVPVDSMHKELRSKVASQFPPGTEGAVFLAGGDVTLRYDTDVEQTFRQESNFIYMTGYMQPNATVLMELATERTVLFIPDRPVDYAVWNGAIEDPVAIQKEFGFDDVRYDFEFTAVLGEMAGGDPNFVVFTMPTQTRFIPDEYSVNDSDLWKALYTSRVVKTNDEVDLMRTAANVSSDAHIKVMQAMAPMLFEYNMEAAFIETCLNCGLQIQAYLPIVASGNGSAILHYTANDQRMFDGQLLLIDASAEYLGYAADITRTFPVNGKFTAQQRTIYNMVLEVQEAVIDIVKPGIPWSSLQATNNDVLCKVLIEEGFVTSTQETCLNKRVYSLFMPHGVSHLLGLDVHDVSVPPTPDIEAGFVFTVEPGIYFNDALMFPAFDDPAFAPYIDEGLIRPLLEARFGGVRIEDDILVTEDGYENLSLAPKTVEEIENLMSS